MTENQAKQLICPVRTILAQDEYPATAPFNPATDFHQVPRCKASACMLWRWKVVGPNNDGYCGLGGSAGAP